MTATATTSATPTTPKPTAIPTYTWQEAANHVGEKATVTGPVIDEVYWPDTGLIGTTTETQLGIGKSWQDPSTFVVVLWIQRDKLPADRYVGQTIAVTGIITRQPMAGRTGLKIDVNELSRIAVVSGSAPATQAGH